MPFFWPLDVYSLLSWSQLYAGVLVLSEKILVSFKYSFFSCSLTTDLIKIPNHCSYLVFVEKTDLMSKFISLMICKILIKSKILMNYLGL